MSDLGFKKNAHLYVLCMILFLNSYYSIEPRHLSFVDDTKNFKTYPWGIDVLEEILREHNIYKESMITILGVEGE